MQSTEIKEFRFGAHLEPTEHMVSPSFTVAYHDMLTSLIHLSRSLRKYKGWVSFTKIPRAKDPSSRYTVLLNQMKTSFHRCPTVYRHSIPQAKDLSSNGLTHTHASGKMPGSGDFGLGLLKLVYRVYRANLNNLWQLLAGYLGCYQSSLTEHAEFRDTSMLNVDTGSAQ